MNQETSIVYDEHSLNSVADFKATLVSNYKQQLQAQLGDEETAKAFMANAISIIQANPTLLECEPATVFNGLMIMSSLSLMPSSISGEAYLIPRNNKKTGTKQAQFQLGYQGLVTLLYRAGIESITGAIVYEKDGFELNGTEVVHKIDPRLKKADRGERVGAYTKVSYRGHYTYKYMNGQDILDHAAKFSESYNSSFSPWKNDPEGMMWLKTVLKQHSKLLPKNDVISKAIAEDNRDSVIETRRQKALKESESLKMGNLITNNEKENAKEDKQTTESNQA